MSVRLMEPWLLLLAVGVVPLMVWYLHNRSRREGRVRFSTLGVLAQLPGTARITLRPTLDVLRLLALLLIVLALARPAVTRTAEASPRAGIDLVLAIDISYSMSEHDLGPKSRLEYAKEVVQEFISNRTGDRVGLVAFAGEAVGVSPLTQDYPVLLGMVGDVNHGRLPEGTAIGNGLATSVNLVREGQGKSRVVILLTDGQSNAGDVTPDVAMKMAQTLNIRTYTVGVGASTGGPAGGRRSGIDEDGLRRIADTTGGAYFRATDEETLAQIYRTIDELEKNELGTQREVQVQDLSGYVLLASALLLGFEVLLGSTLFRRVA